MLASRILTPVRIFRSGKLISTSSRVWSEERRVASHTLLDEMIQRIKISGPLTVEEYMKMSLTHPQFGFYMKQDVFGSKGHFITSPEISQMFGELVGIWALYQWMQCESRKPLRIVELGPGRGTLTADMCRVMSQFKQADGCVEFHLVEISSPLRKIQERNICRNCSGEEFEQLDRHNPSGIYRSETMFGQPITWYRSLDQIPLHTDGFSLFLANEFFDAFPINKFVKVEDNWKEMLIDWSEECNSLKWIQTRNRTPASQLFSYLDASIVDSSDQLEISPATLLFIDDVIERINQNDGCLLICDYGHDQARSSSVVNRDTFRAYRNHSQCDPLAEPGMADLTADVDFAAIRARLKARANVFGTVTQRHFLTQLGIGLRLKKLLQVTNDSQQAELISGAKMLLEDMGERFKFMAIFGQNRTTLPVCFEL